MSVQPAATVPIATTDFSSSVIQPFHSTRELVFNQTRAAYEKSITKWEKDCTNLKNFEVFVRMQGRMLQHCDTVPPPPAALDQMKEENLQVYWWIFKPMTQKIGLFAEEIETAMNLFKSSEVHQINEQELEAQQPGLFKQLKSEKEICAAHLKELSDAHNKIIDLKKRMVNIIERDNFNLNWSLQRLCQIVDNKGAPISVVQRSFNNITPLLYTTDIPKPKSEHSIQSENHLRKRLEEIENSLQSMQLTKSPTAKTSENSGATIPQPTETATVAKSNDAATADKPAEAATAPQPTVTATVTKSNDMTTTDKPAEGATTPKPTVTATATKSNDMTTTDKPAEAATAPQPTVTATATKSNDVATADKPAEGATAPKPTETATADKPKPTGGAWYEKPKGKNT